jgi:hypothetical protein
MATNSVSPRKGKVVDIPTVPTIGTATAGNQSASIAFTPSIVGGPTTTFTALSNPGSITGTGTSPIVVAGLTSGTAYTFTVRGTNPTGSSEYTAASNSVTPTSSVTADYLVVAGGGGGFNDLGGGGGAGGYRSGSSFALPASFTVTVGAGGDVKTKGSDSVFSTITSTGGGEARTSAAGGPGGSGAGGTRDSAAGGAGNTPSTSPSQGNNGGAAGGSGGWAGGGGGGASAAGSNASSQSRGGPGGAGTASSITGTSVTRAGGGGGASYPENTFSASGGAGGGGNGGRNDGGGTYLLPTAGAVNTGGGGGGASNGPGASATIGKGGSGIVIIRYPDTSSDLVSIAPGLTYTYANTGGYKIYQFTAGTGTVSV